MKWKKLNMLGSFRRLLLVSLSLSFLCVLGSCSLPAIKKNTDILVAQGNAEAKKNEAIHKDNPEIQNIYSELRREIKGINESKSPIGGWLEILIWIVLAFLGIDKGSKLGGRVLGMGQLIIGNIRKRSRRKSERYIHYATPETNDYDTEIIEEEGKENDKLK